MIFASFIDGVSLGRACSECRTNQHTSLHVDGLLNDEGLEAIIV
jgi:hypothetical protein